ncbi:E3 ubiquitin-protein ligase RNF138-like [Triplophysa dalaica]|uniref:E3 ubiquitin-protein ligase RNF138-like n=1 Tax=Triplophysa dalaica TaxID=1582913 RepID=UPI0024DF54E1|nr:E3 ubiquitin-protein ligase RNF138-like [Triplophysa dalaica]
MPIPFQLLLLPLLPLFLLEGPCLNLHIPSQRATVIAVPAPPASPAPLYQTLDDEFDDCLLQTEINEIGMRQQEQIQGSTLRTLVCPYCQMGGLDAKELRDHCNAQLAYDSTRVVCPVCVVLHHGDPQYYSRNFIGHLNLRHIEDITNDEVNFQCALMESYNENIPM